MKSIDWAGLGVFVTALTGVAALILSQTKMHRKVNEIGRSVNHVDIEPEPDGAPHTLGQLVKGLSDRESLHHRVVKRDLDQLKSDVVIVQGEVGGVKARMDAHEAWSAQQVTRIDRLEVPGAGP